MSVIKISELNNMNLSDLSSDDFFPIVDSGSLTTYRCFIDTFGDWYAVSGSASYSANTLSASYAKTSSWANNLVYPNNSTASFAITASFAQNVPNSNISISSSWASQSLSGSYTKSASWATWAGTNLKQDFFSFVDPNLQLSTDWFFIRKNRITGSGEVPTSPITNIIGDVQLTFNDNVSGINGLYGNTNNNLLRFCFDASSSVDRSAAKQVDESVKIIVGTKDLVHDNWMIPQKILGFQGDYQESSVRLYAGTRLQSSSFGSYTDAVGWDGINGKQISYNSTYFPKYPVPVIGLMANYDANVVKFKEGVAKSIRRFYDANILTESFWKPFSSVRISLESTSTSGSVDTLTNTFWFPHYLFESNRTNVGLRLGFDYDPSTDNFYKKEKYYDYYESIVPLYKGQRVTIEFDADSRGVGTSSFAPKGYFQNSGSFSCAVKIISTGSSNNVTNAIDTRAFILETTDGSAMPDHIFTSGFLELPPNQLVGSYHGQTGSISPCKVLTMTSGSSDVKNRFLLTLPNAVALPAVSYNLQEGYTFSASFYPYFTVEHIDTQGIQFYLSPISCSLQARGLIGPTGSGAPYVGSFTDGTFYANLYVGDANVSQSKIFYWCQEMYSTLNYVKKITTGTDLDVNGRPTITSIVSGHTMKVRKANTNPEVPNTSKLKQSIFLKNSDYNGQITRSFVIAGIDDGFVDGQELSIYNETNFTVSFWGIGNDYTTSSINKTSRIQLPGNSISYSLLPNKNINMIYYDDPIDSINQSYWRVLSFT